MSAPPSYRERLRVEGAVLAASGVVAAGALVGFVPAARRWPWNTVGQLALTGALVAWLGRAAVRRALDEAVEVAPGQEGEGEPTPLWALPLIVSGLAAPFLALPRTGLPGSSLAGWDAALRIAGGSALAGLAQAVLFARAVGADERARGRRYVRGAGSRLLGGTRLVFTAAR